MPLSSTNVCAHYSDTPSTGEKFDAELAFLFDVSVDFCNLESRKGWLPRQQRTANTNEQGADGLRVHKSS
jgi:hypothetical protein